MKNILILNNRALDYYDFSELKARHPLKIFCVVTENYYQKLSSKTKTDVDHFFILPAQSLLEPIPFPIEEVRTIIRDNFEVKEELFINSSDEVNVTVAARLRKEFNLKGAKPTLIKKFKHKATQKAALQSYGIRVPRYRSVSYRELKNKFSYSDLVSYLGLPFIIKPNSRGMTFHVVKISCYEEFEAYLSTMKLWMDFRETFSIEEFIDGRLYHCDLVTQNNKTYFAQCSEYFFNGLAFVNGKVHGSIPLEVEDPLNLRLIDYAEKATQILGLKNGCSHHEIFVQANGEMVYLESGARPPGSLVPLIYKRWLDINLLNCSLELDSSLPLTTFKPAPKDYYFWAMFPLQTGVIKDIVIPALQSQYNADILVKVGDTITSSTCLFQRAATLIARNQNYAALYKDFTILKAHAFLTMESANQI